MEELNHKARRKKEYFEGKALEEATLRVKVLFRRADFLILRIRTNMVDITDFEKPEWMGRDRSELCAIVWALDLIDEIHPGALADEQKNKLLMASLEMKEAGRHYLDHTF